MSDNSNSGLIFLGFILFLIVIFVLVFGVISSSNNNTDDTTADNNDQNSNKIKTTYYPGLKWVCYPTYYNEDFANLNVLMSSTNYYDWSVKSGVGLLNPNIFSGTSYNFYSLNTSTTSTNSSNVCAFAANSNQQYYTIVWYGYFKANVTGNWTFMTTSDDGSYVWVNTDTSTPITNFDLFDPTNLSACGIVLGPYGNSDVPNGGLHKKQFLKALNFDFTKNKYYPIIILYGQNNNDSTFQFQIQDPNGTLYNNNFSNILYNKISN